MIRATRAWWVTPARIGLALAVSAQLGCGDGGGLVVGQAALLWDDIYDAGTVDATGSRTQDNALAMAACAGRIVIIGTSSPLSGGDNDFLIRTFDATSGQLLWSDRVQSGAHDDARSVACDRERVLTTFTSGFGSRAAVLRAYDIDDGALLWSREYADRFGNDATDLRLNGSEAFVSFTAWDEGPPTNPTSAPTVIMTRAVDADSGELIWKNEYDADQPAARGYLTVGRRLVCSIHVLGDGLRCFRRDDGTLLWSAANGSGDSDDLELSSDEQVVLLSSYSYSTRVGSLAAYDATSGLSLWNHDYELATIVSPLAAGRLFFIWGDEFIIDPDDDFYEETIFVMEAREAATGELVWSDRRPGHAAGGAFVDWPRAVVATFGWDSQTRDVRDGSILSDELAPDDPATRGLANIAVDSGRYYLGGTFIAIGDGPNDRDMGIRAYAYP